MSLRSNKNILVKAVLNCGELLNLSHSELLTILHINDSPRLDESIELSSEQCEIALLLIRITISLFQKSGGDIDVMRHFMKTQNLALGSVPAVKIKTKNGLLSVLTFLDLDR